MIGTRYGRLVVEKPAPSGVGGRRFLCRCDCGGEIVAVVAHLNYGRIKSCGCLKSGRGSGTPRAHGMTGSRTYNLWINMRQRCSNANQPRFKDWGGRGIRVCERWQVFENFLADMGEVPDGMSIEREDNDGDYQPGNCVWATPSEQRMNQRPRRPTP